MHKLLCYRTLQDESLSYVHLQISPTVNVVTLTVSVTMMDMVSAVGGTLGLFSGFSIISLMELVYWVGKKGSKVMTGGGGGKKKEKRTG